MLSDKFPWAYNLSLQKGQNCIQGFQCKSKFCCPRTRVCLDHSMDSIPVDEVQDARTRVMLLNSSICQDPFSHPTQCMNLSAEDKLNPGWPTEDWNQDNCGCIPEQLNLQHSGKWLCGSSFELSKEVLTHLLHTPNGNLTAKTFESVVQKTIADCSIRDKVSCKTHCIWNSLKNQCDPNIIVLLDEQDTRNKTQKAPTLAENVQKDSKEQTSINITESEPASNSPKLTYDQWFNLFQKISNSNNNKNEISKTKENQIGCFIDSSVRDLKNVLIESGATIESCNNSALSAGQKQYGLQSGGECFGDNVQGSLGTSNACNLECTANTNYICGGHWSNSVFSTIPIINTEMPKDQKSELTKQNKQNNSMNTVEPHSKESGKEIPHSKEIGKEIPKTTTKTTITLSSELSKENSQILKNTSKDNLKSQQQLNKESSPVKTENSFDNLSKIENNMKEFEELLLHPKLNMTRIQHSNEQLKIKSILIEEYSSVAQKLLQFKDTIKEFEGEKRLAFSQLLIAKAKELRSHLDMLINSVEQKSIESQRVQMGQQIDEVQDQINSELQQQMQVLNLHK